MTLLLAPSGAQIAVTSSVSEQPQWARLRCPRCWKVQTVSPPTANLVAMAVNTHDCRNNTWDGRPSL